MTTNASANASMQKQASPAGAVARIEAGGTHYTVLGTPLLDVAGRPIGELRILRSSESARQRVGTPS